MNEPARLRLLHGSELPLSELRTLTAGDLTAEVDGIDLRYVKVGGVEIIRRLYVAVRDASWGTIPAEIIDPELVQSENGFQVDFDARHRRADVDFSWHGRIVGSGSPPSMSYSMDGVANAAFLFNRIGLCVLHPVEQMAGRPFDAHTASGISCETFPALIGPQLIEDGVYQGLFPPFTGLDIEMPTGKVRFRFEGDRFEMEDQRNWADASFKTYSTPLALGNPHTSTAGQLIKQKVTVEATARSDDRRRTQDRTLQIEVGAPLQRSLPPLGLGMAGHGIALTEAEVELLRRLELAHVRVDLNLSDPDVLSRIDRAQEVCKALCCKVEAAIYLSSGDESTLAQLGARLAKSDVARIIVLDRDGRTGAPSEVTRAGLVRMARAQLDPLVPNVPIGGGTDFLFCELNRGRPDTEPVDFLAFTTNPQVHARDDLSLVETLQAQGETVRSALAISGGKPVVVSPTYLGSRPPYDASEHPPGEALPAHVDVRQPSLFAAPWTLGSIKYTAEAGAAALTYFETTGWCGVMEREAGPRMPSRFPSSPGQPFPLYFTLAALAGFLGAEILEASISDPLSAVALALRQEGSTRVLLGNLTHVPLTVELAGLPQRGATVKSIVSELSAKGGNQEPRERLVTVEGAHSVALSAYEVVAVDLPA